VRRVFLGYPKTKNLEHGPGIVLYIVIGNLQLVRVLERIQSPMGSLKQGQNIMSFLRNFLIRHKTARSGNIYEIERVSPVTAPSIAYFS
jgi:hypothetical protein